MNSLFTKLVRCVNVPTATLTSLRTTCSAQNLVKCPVLSGAAVWTAVRNVHSIHAQTSQLSYAKRMKLLQDLKEKQGINSGNMKLGKFLVLHKNRGLLTDDLKLLWLDYPDFAISSEALHQNAVLLGLSDDCRLQFAVQTANMDPGIKTLIEDRSGGVFADFRLAVLSLSIEELALASKAIAVHSWHRKNKFCSSCAKPTMRNSSGSCRTCVECSEIFYPSLSPVGIVLITDYNKSKLLLVRQSRHPKGMYSCVAGYVDAGTVGKKSNFKVNHAMKYLS